MSLLTQTPGPQAHTHSAETFVPDQSRAERGQPRMCRQPAGQSLGRMPGTIHQRTASCRGQPTAFRFSPSSSAAPC